MTKPRFAIRYQANRTTWHIQWHDVAMPLHDVAELGRRMQAAGVDAQLRAEFDACRARLAHKSTLIAGGVNGCWTYCPADVASRVVRLLGEVAGVEPQPMQRRRIRGRLR